MPATDDKTLPLSVKNTGFLLDRMGEDCHPLQFLRELTQNAIEAINKNGGKGEILWDVDWNMYELDGVYKLCIIDNGLGMTGPEMIEYINQLSSSGSEQSFTGNYGVGAKIAAATKNHHGVIYLSWKDGKGSMIHLWRNPKTGVYGLKQFHKESDGSYPHFLEVDDDIKPPQIKKNGTMVVLLGNSEKQNTLNPPEGTPVPSRWVAKYLNTRYFRFPKEVTIKCREGWTSPRTDHDRNKLRTVTGQEKYLNDHSKSSGKVELSNGVAHWWILNDSELDQDSSYINSFGHTAALYQDELFEMETGKARTARLQQFGIIFGYRQVVIYIEPVSRDDQKITTTTARTNLLINNEALPWEDWSIEFREHMPKELEDFVEEKAAASAGSDHTQSIRERLKSILDLFRLSRYKPTPRGSIQFDDESILRGGVPEPAGKSGSQKSGSSGSGGGGGGRAGGIYSAFEKKGGTPGEKVEPDNFPNVTWISTAKGNREPNYLEDRAAGFILDQNRLLINEDFRVFSDMILRHKKEHGNKDAFTEVIKEVVHAWFEQALVETVMGVQALQNSREWSIEDIKRATSEEALTAAILQRYHVNNVIRRELGAKLGKSRATALQEA